MSQSNLHVMQVLVDNIYLMVGSVVSWAFTLGGFYDVTRGLLTLVALMLSCMVSGATLYKIMKDLSKKGKQGDKGEKGDKGETGDRG